MVVQTNHTYYGFVQVQTSLQAELIIYIKSFTSEPQQSMELPDF
jgi:hypothetical protein